MPRLQGLCFPPLPVKTGGLARVTGADAVEQAIRAVLLTEPGERVGRPGFGAGLRRFLYAPDTLSTRTLLRQTLLDALRRDGPEAEVQEILIRDGDRPGMLLIEILYVIAGDPTPRALTTPLHLDPL